MKLSISSITLLGVIFFLPAFHIEAQQPPTVKPLTSEYTVGSSVQPMIIMSEGWQQKIVIVNVSNYSPEPTIGTLRFYTKDGKAWQVPLKGYGPTDHVDINLNPGQMIAFETEVSLNAQTLGWASFDLVSDTTKWEFITPTRRTESRRRDCRTS